MAKHEKYDPHWHDHIYFNSAIELATHHAKAELRMSNTWDALEFHVETGEYESAEHLSGSLLYRHWFTNFFNVFLGGTFSAEFEEKKSRGVLGVGYTLPLLVEANLLVDHTARFALDLEKRFQWTSTVFSEVEATFRQERKPEFGFSLMYGPTWSWAVGLMVNDGELGAGLQYKF